MAQNYATNVTASDHAAVQIGNNVYQSGNKDEECLHALLETNPQYDKQKIMDSKGGLLPSASEWILHDEQFKRWRDGRSCFLWIKGDPGKGKTMLLCSIIENLASMPSNRLGYFFCQAGQPKMNNATAVLRGLTYGLARHDRTALSHVRKAFDQTGDKLFNGHNSWEAMYNILSDILKDPNMSGTVLVVDALDECEHELPNLLKFIVDTHAENGTKWIVSSRKWPQIKNGLRRIVGSQEDMTTEIEKNEGLVSEAVEKFIHSKLSLLPWWDECEDGIKTKIQHTFETKADNTFLWVAMVYKELTTYTMSEALVVLEDFPPGLGALYQRMMQNIAKVKCPDRCKQILAAVSIAYRPLKLKELAFGVESLYPFRNHLDTLRDAVLLCGSFLTLRDEGIFFVHQSAKDFLLNSAREKIMPSGIAKQHQNMVERFLKTLDTTLKRDICGLNNPGSLADMPRLENSPLDPIGYACTYWVDHLKHADLGNRQTQQTLDTWDARVNSFLRTHLLHWFEVLSLLRSISKAGPALEKLAALLANTTLSGLLGFIEDAHRFVLFNGGVIEIAPLQVYASALVFSPVQSAVRRHFRNEAPDWITKMPVVDDEWDSCIQVLEGHKWELTAITFSADDLWLATGSDDGTLKIWDAATGVCVQSFQSEANYIDSIIHSASQGWLSLGHYRDNKARVTIIKVWNPEKNNFRAMTESGYYDVVVSALSPDGKWLACTTNGPIIKVWNVETGVLLKIPPGTSDDAGVLAFSGDSKWLAFGCSRYGTVTVWDTTTWNIEWTRREHTNVIFSMACSANSQLLVSGDYSDLIIIWDIATGELKRKVKAHRCKHRGIVASGDGSLFATECADFGEFWIWDTNTGEHVQTLRGSWRFSNILAFSADGRRLASGEYTIEVWDTTKRSSFKSPPKHADIVSSVAFSEDAKWAASGSFDGVVKVWDTETFSCKQTLTGHKNDRVTVTAIVLDDWRLVSVSADKTAMVWDFQKGILLATLTGHTGHILSLLLLPGGKQLVSSSYDGTIRVWDLDPLDTRCVCLVQASDKAVTSVTLGADGHTIVSIHMGGGIQIWNISTWECLQTFELGGYQQSAIAISPDGQWVAMDHSSSRGIVEIRNLHSGLEAAHSERFALAIRSLSFDGNNMRLNTNVGVLGLCPSVTEERLQGGPPMLLLNQGYGISSDKTWIVKDDTKMLWIPKKYRPWVSAMVGSTVIIGCFSGYVYRMTFLTDNLGNHSTSTRDRAKSRRRSGATSAPLCKELKPSEK
ncbi:hypothetical protein NW768_002770 [Fusarium equiseti]|uniref:NACHT domain-containing protein n=1 Tax=Fusarium equiseti TaxID=61235 RepID=A0ABQ8RK02_FUSEQ|nr:hypothetical protein NW768_002770 [Fusarium equiseti]